MTIKIQLDTHALKAIFDTEEAQLVLRKAVVKNLVESFGKLCLPPEVNATLDAAIKQAKTTMDQA